MKFFLALFKSEGHVTPLVLPFSMPRMEPIDDAMLQSLPEMDEFRSVVFSLDANSAPSPDSLERDFINFAGRLSRKICLKQCKIFQECRIAQEFF